MYRVLFSIGSVPVHSYYVLWTVALCVAVLWTKSRLMNALGYEEPEAARLLLWALGGMYLGARVGGVIDNWSYFSANPLLAFAPWEGGLSAVPAMLGAAVTTFGYLRHKRRSLWPVAEVASLPMAATIAIGRWGCFLNGCCFGRHTTSFLGVRFPFDRADILRHPTQLYEAFLGLLLLGLLFVVERWLGSFKARRVRGAVLCPLFMMGYGLYRVLFDSLRQDSLEKAMSTAVVLGAVAATLGFLWLGHSLLFRRSGSEKHF
jgi:phosphatidylglycerol:prolipoprotein diacylglycerol transferase